MLKRVSLFLIVNFITVTTISLILNILKIQPYLTKQGLNPFNLLVFCLLWGFGGAFISLGLSRYSAKKMMQIELVSPNTTEPDLQELLGIIHFLCQKAGIKKMPEVGLYDSDEINAFATGPTRNRALVAVSVGLLRRMNADQITGVLAHEISHIANGDMITMTLMQGVVNSFVLFFARIVAFVITQDARDGLKGLFRFWLTLFLEIVFNVFGTIVVSAFSRHREYRADAGSARLVGAEKIISALEVLKYQSNLTHNGIESPALATMKIYGKQGGFFSQLFASHPSLADRIKQLETL